MRQFINNILSIAMIIVFGCSHIRLNQGVRVGANDWPMYGGSMGRTNVAHSVVSPPLVKAWEYDATAGFSSYAPAAADSFVFVGNLQGELHIINIRTGKGVGTNDFGSAIIGTPVINGDLLYIALGHDEESLIAFDVSTSRKIWTAKLDDIETSPLLIGNRLYVASMIGKISCLEKESGKVVWTYSTPQEPRATFIHSSPASDGKLLVFGCDDGSLYAIRASDGGFEWKSKASKSIVATPSIQSGAIYVGSLDGIFYAFDLATGRILWKQNLGSGMYSSQAINENRIYIGTSIGTVYCLDRGTGKIVWTFAAKSVVSASPLLSGTTLYVGSLDKSIYALKAETGEVLWQHQGETRIRTTPIVYEGLLIVLSEDHSVVAFREERQH